MTDLHGISASDFAKWRVPCCFYLAEKVEDLDKAVGLELWQPHGAQADRSVCGMGKGKLERTGLVEGHTPQAKEMSQLVAPFRAHRE